MTRLLAACLAGVVVGGAGAARQDAPAKSIDGTYKVLSATFGGKSDTEKAAKATFEFKDGMLTISDGPKKEEGAKYKLDASKTPGHIDIMPGKGKTDVVKGIYQTKSTPAGLELSIAFAKDGKDRPTDFKGGDEDTVVLKLLRRGEK